MQDEMGHEISALVIFTMVIDYLKNLVVEELHKTDTKIVQSDIHWVLTVPAIWDKAAKQFMREAAEMVRCLSNFMENFIDKKINMFTHVHIDVNIQRG